MRPVALLVLALAASQTLGAVTSSVPPTIRPVESLPVHQMQMAQPAACPSVPGTGIVVDIPGVPAFNAQSIAVLSGTNPADSANIAVEHNEVRGRGSLKVVKQYDASSKALFQAETANKVIPTMTITIHKQGDPREYMVWTLSSAFVSGLTVANGGPSSLQEQTNTDKGHVGGVESVTFRYESIAIKNCTTTSR